MCERSIQQVICTGRGQSNVQIAARPRQTPSATNLRVQAHVAINPRCFYMAPIQPNLKRSIQQCMCIGHGQRNLQQAGLPKQTCSTTNLSVRAHVETDPMCFLYGPIRQNVRKANPARHLYRPRTSKHLPRQIWRFCYMEPIQQKCEKFDEVMHVYRPWAMKFAKSWATKANTSKCACTHLQTRTYVNIHM